ncbi:hypothetical protein Hanom_Chr17g01535411 [Helianthus anomalus]
MMLGFGSFSLSACYVYNPAIIPNIISITHILFAYSKSLIEDRLLCISLTYSSYICSACWSYVEDLLEIRFFVYVVLYHRSCGSSYIRLCRFISVVLFN